MPQDCQNKLEIQPGHFKYGWYADPQRFAAALPDSTTNAAATAAQKAMEGITITPARSSPLDVRRYSSSSGADMSSQSWYPSRSPSRSTSTALTAPITISGKEVSTGSLGASSMYSETVDESVMSDSSMMTTRTNKTRRGKRGGKKQRENSQLRKQQSLPPSPTMVSSSCPRCTLDHESR